MADHADLIDGGRAERKPILSALPAWPRHLLLAAACAALALGALPSSESTSPLSSRAAPAGACVPGGQDAATAARLRARQAQRAQIRAVPPGYRRAARQASRVTKGRVAPEYFLALAYNRTLYGELLRSEATRRYADRGPLQWNLQQFAEVAAPGHHDPTLPLDSFLAVAQVVLAQSGSGSGDAFAWSLHLGSTVDQARADAETFDVLAARTLHRSATPQCARAHVT